MISNHIYIYIYTYMINLSFEANYLYLVYIDTCTVSSTLKVPLVAFSTDVIVELSTLDD